jgi:hypothetical protein
MSRQYFADVLLDPPTLNPLAAAITATSETALWPVSLFTPISVGDIRPGKVYQVKAGGIMSTTTSGTLIITPRIGVSATAATNITMGASVTQTVPVSLSGTAWYLQFTFVIRTVGLAGANSTCIGNGFLQGAGTAATAGSGLDVSFGGTSASFDASVAEGLWIGWTLSAAGSCTPEWLVWQSLN